MKQLSIRTLLTAGFPAFLLMSVGQSAQAQQAKLSISDELETDSIAAIRASIQQIEMELLETETAIGTVDFSEGTDDINVVREYQREVIEDERFSDVDANGVFEAVEQMPQFPGGDTELMKYLNKNIVYPTLAAQKGIQGRVVVKFVVKADGSIGDVVVVRPKDPDLDREAVRVVKSLPNFIPGRMHGQPVNVWFTLPVSFKLP